MDSRVLLPADCYFPSTTLADYPMESWLDCDDDPLSGGGGGSGPFPSAHTCLPPACIKPVEINGAAIIVTARIHTNIIFVRDIAPPWVVRIKHLQLMNPRALLPPPASLARNTEQNHFSSHTLPVSVHTSPASGFLSFDSSGFAHHSRALPLASVAPKRVTPGGAWGKDHVAAGSALLPRPR